MANAVKGEVELTLKSGKKLILVAGMEAMIQAEGLYGKPSAQIAADAEAGFVGAIRALFWGMLLQHQPTITPAEVSLIIQENMDTIEGALTNAMKAASPDPEEREDQDPPQPAKPQRGKSSGRSGAKRG
jgi:hypothetical protein